MKTTLNLDDRVMAELKREAARQQRTLSEMVEAAVRAFLRAQLSHPELVPLPSFAGGGTRVDIADRDALYHALQGH